MFDFSLTEEQQALTEMARRFAKERIAPVAAECDRESRFPMEVFRAAWEIGLVNPTVPSDFGGAGMGELESCIIAEELAYACAGIETSIMGNTLALTPIKLGGQRGAKEEVPRLAHERAHPRELLHERARRGQRCGRHQDALHAPRRRLRD